MAKNTIGTNNQKNREVWLEKTLKKIPAHSKILDAGAGELQYKKLCEHLNYTSQDFAQYNGKGDNKALQMGNWDNSKLDIVSDITYIPVKDKDFDAIMCVEVLEHLPEPALAIKEFSRIIKSGGTLILTAPFCSLTHFAPYYFGNGYSKYWYEKILKENGFEIIEIVTNGNYYDYLAQEIRRLPSIVNNYSKSKINIFERIIIKLILNILNKYNKKDANSSELLCFGYHVLAQKVK